MPSGDNRMDTAYGSRNVYAILFETGVRGRGNKRDLIAGQ